MIRLYVPSKFVPIGFMSKINALMSSNIYNVNKTMYFKSKYLLKKWIELSVGTDSRNICWVSTFKIGLFASEHVSHSISDFDLLQSNTRSQLVTGNVLG